VVKTQFATIPVPKWDHHTEPIIFRISVSLHLSSDVDNEFGEGIKHFILWLKKKIFKHLRKGPKMFRTLLFNLYDNLSVPRTR